MTGMELKPQFEGLQLIFDRCIDRILHVKIDKFDAEEQILKPEDLLKKRQDEYNLTISELAEMYDRFPILLDVRNCFSKSEFFWDSRIYEALEPEEKKQYLAFPISEFSFSKFAADNGFYDASLPYFSQIVRSVILERYAAYIRRKKECSEELEKQYDSHKKSSRVEIAVANPDNPFCANFTDEQFAFLADGINEVQMFNVPISVEDLKAIFTGKPREVLRSSNNRLVAFFFAGLSDRGLITPYWQSVIANYKLFLSKNLQTEKYINQSDLSSATNYIRDLGVSGKYATIDSYLKQVKKH